ncbi:methylglyoxal synthase [Thalassospira marina]|uniref:Methylglyoxal synthase n=1 Tax=Thalassospira marina TaxID=2048283 RepID=A0A2N3KIZ6_9PROT|nr:methylglyoxal synthase [Thalassospira marina]AUG51535.1 methylglyoxal synthase [Thalassospira marina]PKR50515.1 methylglyoxal synthase [Thalassospira marina]
MSLSIGLVAHDRRKPEMADWLEQHIAAFTDYKIYATGTTGRVLQERFPKLDIVALKSGPFGGDQQLGSMIAHGQLQAMFFFTDPMTPQPHDVDVRALIRLANMYEVPIACNRSTADLLISNPRFQEICEQYRGHSPEQIFSEYTSRKV